MQGGEQVAFLANHYMGMTWLKFGLHVFFADCTQVEPAYHRPSDWFYKFAISDLARCSETFPLPVFSVVFDDSFSSQ